MSIEEKSPWLVILGVVVGIAVLGLLGIYATRELLGTAGAPGVHEAFAGQPRDDGLPLPVQVATVLAFFATIYGVVKYGIKQARKPSSNR